MFIFNANAVIITLFTSSIELAYNTPHMLSSNQPLVVENDTLSTQID